MTDNFVTTMAVITCACNVAIMSQSYYLRATTFYNFATFTLKSLGQLDLVSISGQSTLWCGTAGVVASVCLGYFALKNQKSMMRLMMLVVFAIACIEIAIGAVLQQNIGTVDSVISGSGGRNPACSSGPSTAPTLVTNTMHFAYAMFNGCCASQGYSCEKFTTVQGVTFSGGTICGSDNQVDVTQCLLAKPPKDSQTTYLDCDTDGYVKWCDSLTPLNKGNNICLTSGSPARTCYTDRETYRQYNFTVGSNLNYVCGTLSKSFVDITGLAVPGSGGLSQVSDYTKKTILPLVGPVPVTFGCGGGYANLFLGVALLWVKQNLRPATTALLVCGSVTVVVIVLALATSCSSRTKSETAEQAYERYMAQVSASQGQNSAPNSRPATQAFELANPGHVHESARVSLASNYSQQAGGGGGGGAVPYGVPAAYMQDQNKPYSQTFNVDDKI